MGLLRWETLKYAQGGLLDLHSGQQGSCVDWYSRLQQSLSVFRVSRKVSIDDPPIHHVAHHPTRRHPNTLVRVRRGASLSRSGVPIGHVLRMLHSSPDVEVAGARNNNNNNITRTNDLL